MVVSAISANTFLHICKKELPFSQNGSFFLAPHAKAHLELVVLLYPTNTAALTWGMVL